MNCASFRLKAILVSSIKIEIGPLNGAIFNTLKLAPGNRPNSKSFAINGLSMTSLIVPDWLIFISVNLQFKVYFI